MLQVVFLLRVVAVLAWLTTAACQSSGVGDPYLPEAVPEGGFRRSEVYIETGSPQCRTRVGMVYCLEGDPRYPLGSNGCVNASCPSQQQIDECVYCSCRCRAPEGVSAKTCSCPGGYECVDLLEQGGDGIRGGYCVKQGTIKDSDSSK